MKEPRPAWHPWEQAVRLCVLALLPAVVSTWVHPSRPDWTRPAPRADEVTASQIAAWSGPVLWVDARSRAEFDRSHIPGAVLLNEEQWEDLLDGFLDAWQPGMRVVVYCGGGGGDASRNVARRLRAGSSDLGEIHILHGGIDAWSALSH